MGRSKMNVINLRGNFRFVVEVEQRPVENYLYEVTLVNDDKILLSLEGSSSYKLSDKEIRVLESNVENFIRTTSSYYSKVPQIEAHSLVNKVPNYEKVSFITEDIVEKDHLTYYKAISSVLETLIEKQIIGRSIVFVCKVCDKQSRSSNHAKEHAEIHMEGLKYTCQIRGKDFKTSNAFRCHKKVHK